VPLNEREKQLEWKGALDRDDLANRTNKELVDLMGKKAMS
jgi:hypothetical protein